jgi:hypothetical protein
MKINEFLNESDNEQLDELLGLGLGLAARGIGKLGGALLRGSTTGRQTIKSLGPSVAPTMAGSMSRADRVLQRAGIDTSTWLNSKWRDVLAWQIQRKGMKAFKAGQSAAYENGKIAANIVSDLGLKGFGLATLAYDFTSYYHTRQALQEKYADDPDRLDQELTSLNVSTVASLFLPRVVGSVGRLSSKAVGAIIGKVSPLAGAKVKYWGGMVAKLGEAGAMAYFRSDKGKQWLADALAFVTLGIGAASGIISALGDVLGVGVDMATGLAKVALGSDGDDPDLISIGLAGKWLPSMMNDKKKADQADTAQTGQET